MGPDKHRVVYVVGAVVGLLAVVALMWLDRDRLTTFGRYITRRYITGPDDGARPPSPCYVNLKAVGHALSMYALENAGQFPPNLQTLVTYCDLPPETLLCPTAGARGINAPHVYIPGQCPGSEERTKRQE